MSEFAEFEGRDEARSSAPDSGEFEVRGASVRDLSAVAEIAEQRSLKNNYY